MCDRDMRYLHVSDRWLLEYELERDQIIGQSHYDLFPDLAERWHEVYNRVLQGGTEGSPEEELTPRPDGQPFLLRVCVALKNPAIVGFHVRISDRQTR